MNLKKTLLTSSLSLGSQVVSIALLLLTTGIVLLLASLASLLNLSCLFHELGSLLLFTSQVCLTLELNLLLLRSLVKFKTLTKLCNRHLFHQTVTASLGWVETLGTLDRDLLELTDLADKLLLLGKLSGLLVLLLLERLLHFTMDLVSDRLVVGLLQSYLLSRCFFVGVDLSNHLFLGLNDFL